MSESEIEKGSRSLHEISQALADIKVGIVCITPENMSRPWLLFEAGALSKSIDERTRLCTYLLGGLEPASIPPPLGAFQGTKSTKEDTLNLVRTINQVVSDDPLGDETLNGVFEAMWPRLEERLTSLPTPESPSPAQREPTEILSEILETVRAMSAQRERVNFIDEYIPVLQQFMPLLKQLVHSQRLAGQFAVPPQPQSSFMIDKSLEPPPGSPIRVNSLILPREIANAIPKDTRVRFRSLGLIRMNGRTESSDDVRTAGLDLTLRGKNLDTSLDETYEVELILEIAAARKIALYLQHLATKADQL